MDFTTLTLDEVTRTFGRRRVLNRVSLSVTAGQLVALLGPNGAGKSTLLSIAATLLLPSSGRILVWTAGQSSTGAPTLRGRIGLLGHDLYIYPELSSAENLRFFARLYGLPDVEQRVTDALDRAGLHGQTRRRRVGFLARHATTAGARARAAARAAAGPARRAVHRPRRSRERGAEGSARRRFAVPAPSC